MAGSLHIAVSANFAKTAEQIKSAFERTSGHKIILSTGSSGRIFAQIKNGAPYEIFLAADQSYTKRLEDSGSAVSKSRKVYALGRLVLVSRQKQPDLDLETIKAGKWQYLAIANPELAPYGKAATQVLEKLKIPESAKTKFVFGENVAQTFNYVKSGNADLAFVALSQILSLPMAERGSYYQIPENLYDPIKQELIVLKRAERNSVVAEFLSHLQSGLSQRIIKESGYELPAKHG